MNSEMNTMSRFVRYSSALMVLCASGCGGGADAPQLAPVKGRVTVDGSEPFQEGLIRFIPAPGANLNSREAYTDADGNYTIVFSPGNPGLQPGEYKVMFSLYKMPDGTDPPDQTQEADPKHPSQLGAVQLVPPEFELGKAADCAVTVPEEGGTFDFDLPELKPTKS